ncbi:hypothetical protein [Acutalibacter sp. 1XD8-36]|uniref:hypothetical protein n=1 Tax=Acutalibacter sp. 1XD8-36 TaxID=2320852 RepID=UPI002622740E|nr:hypothetical protein [Acutalibacter sp. 1XD8-36]
MKLNGETQRKNIKNNAAGQPHAVRLFQAETAVYPGAVIPRRDLGVKREHTAMDSCGKCSFLVILR